MCFVSDSVTLHICLSCVSLLVIIIPLMCSVSYILVLALFLLRHQLGLYVQLRRYPQLDLSILHSSSIHLPSFILHSSSFIFHASSIHLPSSSIHPSVHPHHPFTFLFLLNRLSSESWKKSCLAVLKYHPLVYWVNWIACCRLIKCIRVTSLAFPHVKVASKCSNVSCLHDPLI